VPAAQERAAPSRELRRVTFARRSLVAAAAAGWICLGGAPYDVVSAAPPPAAGTATTIALTVPGMRARTIDVDADTLFHTLVFDFARADDGTTYVATGDIPAMWLRDSSAQTLPYVRFVSRYPRLAATVRGVIQRNARNILTDPYANAFTQSYKVWEEKWEVDSLAYTILLDTVYWETTHDRAMFTPRLHWAWEHILATYRCEQRHDVCSGYRSPFLGNRGRGAPFAPTGMLWCAFRPSDDPVRYAFNIPQNLFAAEQLENLADLAVIGYDDPGLAREARSLAAAIVSGVATYGVIDDFRYGWTFAYEVDGLGNALLMDDANMPNLLTLPYFGLIGRDDPVYLATRRFSLSPDNPYWYRGRYGAGLGSPHTPTGWVWPLGLIGQALTADSADEIEEIFAQLRALDGRSGLLYESIDPDRPWHFTRSEFGWANALYAELFFRTVAGFQPYSPRLDRADVSDPFAEKAFTPPRLTGPLQALQASAAIYDALDRVFSR
jgi:meiotically up-regulated gene 157 (Mug157) protein